MNHPYKKISTAVIAAGFIIWILISRSLDPLVTLLAIMIHEAGHLASAALLRIPLAGFRLISCEARIALARGLIAYEKEIFVSAAGPLFNLASAAVAYGLGATLFGETALSFFATVSAALAFLNLLPIGDLDGGRIFYCLFAKLLGLRIAVTLCKLLSFLSLFCLWCISIYILLHTDESITLFFFSASLFTKIFIQDSHYEF